MMYEALNDKFIPQISVGQDDADFDLSIPGREGQLFNLSRKSMPYFASYLNVNAEAHQITREQAINWLNIPLSILSFVIGLAACHTYIGVSMAAGETVAMGIIILASSVTLNTFVNTYFMLQNFYAIADDFKKKVLGSSVLDIANPDMQQLMADQGSLATRIVQFVLWTTGCLCLTALAVYPFYSVDKTTNTDDIKGMSEIVAVAFAGLLYDPVSKMAEKVMANLNYYGRKGINFVISPFGGEIEVEKPPFKITRAKSDHQLRNKAKHDIQVMMPKVRALKQAHIDMIENSRQYYLGLIQSGRNVSDFDGYDDILDPLFEKINPDKTPSFQASFEMLYTYNTSHIGKERNQREPQPSATPLWQTLIGVLHNPLGWISLLGYVNKAISVAGAIWLGVLLSSPLLMLTGYMVAQPLVIKIVDYIKNIYNMVITPYLNGKKIREENETWQQFLARLMPMPLHLTQNWKMMIPIMLLSVTMGFFSCYVAALLNYELFGQTIAWPAIEFITFYMTIMFNVNPVDKVVGALFRFYHKHFGTGKEAERTRNEIRVDEYADMQIKLIKDIDDVKFFEMIRELVENKSTVIADQQQTDQVRSEMLMAFFGHMDLNHYVDQGMPRETEKAGVEDPNHNLWVMQSLIKEFDNAKLYAQQPATPTFDVDLSATVAGLA